MLTDVAIRTLPKPTARREVPDGKISGLFLVVQPSGAKSWAVRYRIGGAPKKLTIGPYPSIDLAAARKRAQEALGEVAGGKDPAAAKVAAKEAAKAAASADDRVADVVEAFVEKYMKRKNGAAWAAEGERILTKEILPRLGKKRLGEVKRAHVHDLLDAIVDRGAPIAANRTLAIFRRLCNWAVERGIIAVSPCDKIKAPSSEETRDRVLTEDEIRAAWAAFDATGWPFGPLAKLLLLTGQRLREVAEMTWDEVNADSRTWTIPKERSKNGESHEVPLSDQSLAIFRSLNKIEGKPADKDAKLPVKGFLFTTNGKTPVSGFSKAKEAFDVAMLEALRKAAVERGDNPDEVKAPPRWTMHDLRRTSASGMASIGTAPHVVEAVLNHKSGTIKGVAAVYNRYAYSAEKRAALEAWARRLDSILGVKTPSNVVELSKARA